LEALIRRDRQISEAAALEAPNNQKLMGRWQDHILRQHGLPTA